MILSNDAELIFFIRKSKVGYFTPIKKSITNIININNNNNNINIPYNLISKYIIQKLM